MSRIIWLTLLCLGGCQLSVGESTGEPASSGTPGPYVVVLGTIQDAGSPHIGCKRSCCLPLHKSPDHTRKVASLGLADPQEGLVYLFEATPDLPAQLQVLQETTGLMTDGRPDGVFLTHAHIGHYTGLMYFGREALGANRLPVYAMPGMQNFLKNNQPWQQLMQLENIILQPLADETAVQLGPRLTVTPFRVPHRDELSETVGYRISGPGASLLFIPDIDKWHRWKKDIRKEITTVDYALIDGSFYDQEEISYRDISEIPHPFVSESMEYFRDLPSSEKQKIHFIHLNHTNPLLQEGSKAADELRTSGYALATYLQRFKL